MTGAALILLFRGASFPGAVAVVYPAVGVQVLVPRSTVRISTPATAAEVLVPATRVAIGHCPQHVQVLG